MTHFCKLMTLMGWYSYDNSKRKMSTLFDSVSFKIIERVPVDVFVLNWVQVTTGVEYET